VGDEIEPLKLVNLCDGHQVLKKKKKVRTHILTNNQFRQVYTFRPLIHLIQDFGF